MTLKEPATRLLRDLGSGDDPSSAEKLLPLVYEELRGLAARYMRQERPDHTLQPTALVHEAYVRLVNDREVEWKGRTHFFAIAARSIRQILVNHALAHQAVKRGGKQRRVFLHEAQSHEKPGQGTDLLAMHEALEELTDLDSRQGQVVELRFFGGLSVEQTAEILGVSPRTVKGDWRIARAWMKERLSG